eukprot:Gregarina_sp_Poly_1__9232@NODE_56_length_17373_cov_108_729111_g48_i0_p2_GENE_NODE_56_length_17373_cov_108_729111_g48_i0NODE_56_length_17373_cov_108_729111_g48_i0_p2_ORF_typecomplete_len1465_score266_30_NODE_56_length_17373_cov_108_729111_g48_i017396133
MQLLLIVIASSIAASERTTQKAEVPFWLDAARRAGEARCKETLRKPLAKVAEKAVYRAIQSAQDSDIIQKLAMLRDASNHSVRDGDGPTQSLVEFVDAFADSICEGKQASDLPSMEVFAEAAVTLITDIVEDHKNSILVGQKREEKLSRDYRLNLMSTRYQLSNLHERRKSMAESLSQAPMWLEAYSKTLTFNPCRFIERPIVRMPSPEEWFEKCAKPVLRQPESTELDAPRDTKISNVTPPPFPKATFPSSPRSGYLLPSRAVLIEGRSPLDDPEQLSASEVPLITPSEKQKDMFTTVPKATFPMTTALRTTDTTSSVSRTPATRSSIPRAPDPRYVSTSTHSTASIAGTPNPPTPDTPPLGLPNQWTPPPEFPDQKTPDSETSAIRLPDSLKISHFSSEEASGTPSPSESPSAQFTDPVTSSSVPSSESSSASINDLQTTAKATTISIAPPTTSAPNSPTILPIVDISVFASFPGARLEPPQMMAETPSGPPVSSSSESPEQETKTTSPTDPAREESTPVPTTAPATIINPTESSQMSTLRAEESDDPNNQRTEDFFEENQTPSTPFEKNLLQLSSTAPSQNPTLPFNPTTPPIDETPPSISPMAPPVEPTVPPIKATFATDPTSPSSQSPTQSFNPMTTPTETTGSSVESPRPSINLLPASLEASLEATSSPVKSSGSLISLSTDNSISNTDKVIETSIASKVVKYLSPQKPEGDGDSRVIFNDQNDIMRLRQYDLNEDERFETVPGVHPGAAVDALVRPRTWLDALTAQAPATAERLKKMLMSEDTATEELEELSMFSVPESHKINRVSLSMPLVPAVIVNGDHILGKPEVVTELHPNIDSDVENIGSEGGTQIASNALKLNVPLAPLIHIKFPEEADSLIPKDQLSQMSQIIRSVSLLNSAHLDSDPRETDPAAVADCVDKVSNAVAAVLVGTASLRARILWELQETSDFSHTNVSPLSLQAATEIGQVCEHSADITSDFGDVAEKILRTLQQRRHSDAFRLRECYTRALPDIDPVFDFGMLNFKHVLRSTLRHIGNKKLNAAELAEAQLETKVIEQCLLKIRLEETRDVMSGMSIKDASAAEGSCEARSLFEAVSAFGGIGQHYSEDYIDAVVDLYAYATFEECDSTLHERGGVKEEDEESKRRNFLQPHPIKECPGCTEKLKRLGERLGNRLTDRVVDNVGDIIAKRLVETVKDAVDNMEGVALSESDSAPAGDDWFLATTPAPFSTFHADEKRDIDPAMWGSAEGAVDFEAMVASAMEAESQSVQAAARKLSPILFSPASYAGPELGPVYSPEVSEEEIAYPAIVYGGPYTEDPWLYGQSAREQCEKDLVFSAKQAVEQLGLERRRENQMHDIITRLLIEKRPETPEEGRLFANLDSRLVEACHSAQPPEPAAAIRSLLRTALLGIQTQTFNKFGAVHKVDVLASQPSNDNFDALRGSSKRAARHRANPPERRTPA